MRSQLMAREGLTFVKTGVILLIGSSRLFSKDIFYAKSDTGGRQFK